MRAPKMIAKLLNRDPNAEEERLRRRQQELTDHLARAVEAAERAGEQRRSLLIEADAIDEASLAKADAACREADDRRQALEAAAREVAQRIAEAETARAVALDSDDRKRVAEELIARAGRLEKAAANLDRVAEMYSEARLNLLGVFTADAPDFQNDAALSSNPGLSVAHHAQFVADILNHGFVEKSTGVPESAIGAAITYMDWLKRRAAAVLDGSAPPDLPEKEPYLRVAIPEESIVISRPVSYHGRLNAMQQAFAGCVTLPSLIADAARAAGIGFSPESADGKAIMRAAASAGMGAAFKPRGDGLWMVHVGDIDPKSGKPKASDMFLHLSPPISLHDWETAERARLRAAA